MLKEKFIDLHLHSYYSDGFLSPKELIKEMKKKNFSIISITDHNVIDGLFESAYWAKRYGIKFITGVEIYSYFYKKNQDLHILGYDFDPQNSTLNDTLKKLQKHHLEEVKECTERLKNFGFKIKLKEILDTPSKNIGLGHFANLLRKYPENVKKIRKDLKLKPRERLSFQSLSGKYFFKDNKILLPEASVSTQKAIEIIKKAGGKAVLAHPGQQLSWHDDKIIFSLKKMGLDGIEAISSRHNWISMEHYQELAKKLGLFVTPGSDFHGEIPKKLKFPICSQWDYFKVSDDFYRDYLNKYFKI